MGEEPRPPQVTVRDPSRPDRPADVLESGADEPLRPKALTPWRRRVLLAVLLVGAAVVGAAEFGERRAATAEQRRLDRVVDLAVERRGGVSSYDPVTGSVRLDLLLRLRNDGPRGLVVEGATAGPLGLVQSPVELGAGDSASLLLRREVSCSPTTPPPPTPLGVLALDLRTAGGPRQVELPLDAALVTDDAPRTCAFRPVEEALDVEVRSTDRSERGIEVVLALTSDSARQVTLVAVEAARGLTTQVTGATGDALPLIVPSRATGALLVEVVVSASDCDAARQARAQLVLRLADDRGRVGQPVAAYDPRFFGGLLAESCST